MSMRLANIRNQIAAMKSALEKATGADTGLTVLTLLGTDGEVIERDPTPEVGRSFRVKVIAIPTGRFLYGEGMDVTKPAIVGDAAGPLYDPIRSFPEIDAIFEKQGVALAHGDAATNAQTARDGATDGRGSHPVSTISDGEAIEAIEKRNAKRRLKEDRATWETKMANRIRTLEARK